MVFPESRIRADLNLDLRGTGKRSGHLWVPISTNESAYGSVLIPIWVIEGRAGPTILLTAAVHGDEYEGPILLHRLARALDPMSLKGRLIIVPVLNPPALAAGSRLSPLDGLNLNRVFPGRREGSASEMIAQYVTSVLFPQTEIVIDLHSGGRSLLYTPLVSMHPLADRSRSAATLAAVLAFAAPVALIGRDLDQAGLLDYTAEAHGKLTISTELGGGGIVSPEAIAVGERGIWNLLRHFGVVESGPGFPLPSRPTRLVETPDLDCFVVARDAGVYEPGLDCGAEVVRGAPLGLLHHLDRCDRDPDIVLAPRDGLLICRRAQGTTGRGDCLAVVASDVDARRLAELMAVP